jgi:replicative DNA helicase
MASFAHLGNSNTDGLPASLHIEVAVLGAMLLDGVAISDATSKLNAEDFSLDSHRRVYRCIIDLMAKGHGIDSLTVGEELERRKELGSIGGPAYLAFLSEGFRGTSTSRAMSAS